jgi:hypothetical protein
VIEAIVLGGYAINMVPYPFVAMRALGGIKYPITITGAEAASHVETLGKILLGGQVRRAM